MSVVTEKTVRKIIQKKIIKEGFFKDARSREGEGDVRYMECDLSGLKDSKVAEKFAKYILLKPEFSQIKDGQANVFTKNMLMVMLTGGLEDDQNRQYDKEVKAYLRNNPDVVGNWVDMLEFSITQVFGPLSKMYCRLFNTLFLTGRKPTSSELRAASSETEPDEVSKKLLLALRAAGNTFAFDKRILQSREGFESEHLILFPNTFINLENQKLDEAKSSFKEEKEKLRRMLVSGVKIKRIGNAFREHFRGIGGKSQILMPLDDFSRDAADTDTNSTIVKNTLIELARECQEKLLDKYNLD